MSRGRGLRAVVAALAVVCVFAGVSPAAQILMDDRDQDSYPVVEDWCPATYSTQFDSDDDEIGDQCDPTPSEMGDVYLVLFLRDQYGDSLTLPACYHYVITHEFEDRDPFVSEGDNCATRFAHASSPFADPANSFHARFTLTERTDSCSGPPLGTEAVIDATEGGIHSATWSFTCDDADGDGLTFVSEYRLFTSDADPDSDNDGVSDGKEVHRLFTRPTDRDSDNGGRSDGAEAHAGSDPLDRTDDGVDATSLARRYAPQLVFHPNEQRWPLSAATFVKRSPLRFADDVGGAGLVAPAGWVNPGRLGGLQARRYRFPARDVTGCEPYLSESTDSLTRPRDDSRDRGGLDLEDGYYLDLPDSLRDGTASTSGDPSTYTGAPIYYRVHAQKRWIRYLVLYGWREAPGGSSDTQCCHEGDGKSFTIHFSETWEPTAAFLNQNGSGMRISWRDLTRVGDTHPVIYSSKDAHAPYPAKGSWPVSGSSSDDVTGNGRRWSTWLATTPRVGAFTTGWWGFGGAWGGLEPVDPAWESVAEHFVGPLGPSRFLGGNPWQCIPACFPDGYQIWP